MFDAILKATNSFFQKGIRFCRSIYVKKIMKLLAFIFEQPSYSITYICMWCLVGCTCYHKLFVNNIGYAQVKIIKHILTYYS